MKFLDEIEQAVEAAWDKLKPHVVPEAEGDAKSVLDDLKAQAGQLGQQAVTDAKADAAKSVADVQQVAKDVLTALGVPYNDLAEADRPTLPSDVEKDPAAGQPTTDVAPTVPAEQADEPSAPEVPAEQDSAAAAQPAGVTTASNPGVVPGQ